MIWKTSIISRPLPTITCILERPRKIGAKYTGASFAPDEFSQPELKHDYEGKRDRWNGYNNEEYTVGFHTLPLSVREGLNFIKYHIIARSLTFACVNLCKNDLCSILREYGCTMMNFFNIFPIFPDLQAILNKIRAPNQVIFVLYIKAQPPNP